MERRKLLGGLLGAFAGAATLAATSKAEALEVTPVQWGPPPPGWGPPPPGWGPGGPGRGRRRPRCWIETRQIPFRDRWGRLRYRTVQREVCR